MTDPKMPPDMERAYAETYPDRVPEYVSGRWSHMCTDGHERWCKRGAFCGICRAEEPLRALGGELSVNHTGETK